MENYRSKLKILFRTIFIVYLFGLLYYTVFAESLGRTGEGMESSLRYNLVIFNEIRRFWTYREKLGSSAFLLNVFGNILAFVPCSLFMALSFERCRSFGRNLCAGFMVSLLIELTQLIFHVGSFDVDDLLLNTCGVLLGYGIYLVLLALDRRQRMKEQDDPALQM